MGRDVTAEFEEFMQGVGRRIYRKEFEAMEAEIRQKDDALAEQGEKIMRYKSRVAELEAIIASQTGEQAE